MKGLPRIDPETVEQCETCIKGKQTRTSFKSKNEVSTKKPLELLHMDLCGPMKTLSHGGKRYIYVLVDDFSRFTWVLFLVSKADCFNAFKVFIKQVEVALETPLKAIRSDHRTEFQNSEFLAYCDQHGVSHNFSAPRTPQQNGVVERKNMTLEDMARTMILANSIPKYFWAEAIATACYILNRAMIRPLLKKTSYELLNGRKPRIDYLRVFG